MSNTNMNTKRPFYILVVNNGGSLNNGTMAMALSLAQGLAAAQFHVKIGLLTAYGETVSMEMERKRFPLDIFEIVPCLWRPLKIKKRLSIVYALIAVISVFKLFLHKLSNGYLFGDDPFISWYAKTDLVAEQSGDMLTEDYSVSSGFLCFFYLFLARLVRKPYCVLSSSIGPFQNKYLRSFAAYVLKNSVFITARESLTERYLGENLNIQAKKIVPVADLAFLLDTANTERMQEILREIGLAGVNKPLVGVSVSSIIYKWGFLSCSVQERKNIYANVFSRFLDEVISKYNVHLVFVPHVMATHCDDREISREIINKMQYKQQVTLVEKEYLPNEMKGIIHACDLFIASRMHAAIAALSQEIPTLVLAYSQKAVGIVGEMLHLSDCIIDMRGISGEELGDKLPPKFDYLWHKRAAISEYLGQKIPKVKVNAQKTIDLVLAQR